MKKTKIFSLICAVLAFCMAFSGCTVFETDTEALMQPPVFSEEQEKLNAALTKVAGEGYNLKYPASGGSNSAFIFKDLDDDGVDEAMAFYSTDGSNTRINVLKQNEEGWVSVYEAAGFTGDIMNIEFADIDKNSPAVIISWADEIGIYRFENNRLKELHSSECYGSDIVDMDGNGFSDVVIFKGSAMDRNVVNIFRIYENKPAVTEDVIIHAEYSGIYSSKTGDIGDGRTAYFIDCSISEGVYLTEMIIIEENTAKEFTIDDFVEDETAEVPETPEESDGSTIIIIGGSLGKRRIFTRNTAVSCMDTNGDGIMELPVEVRDDYAQEASDTVYYLEYMQYNGVNSVPAWHGVANTESGYLFTLPRPWNSAATAVIDSASGELSFVSAENGETVLRVHTVLKSDYQDKYEDYVLAAESEDHYFYVEALADPESNFYIDPITFEDCFILI
ncbi:MAG: hypothetical protein IJO01_08225 [Oscillospiraceae bacterium]|nr:hypothetical protein [Oscillospiraceae bacterium]